jgi:hypothetical protein
MDFDIRDDDDLLAALGAALRTTTHPQRDLVVANAQDAFGYQGLDQELAQLVYDSLLDAGAPSATRAADVARTVVFENDAPPGEVRITVEVPDEEPFQVEADELGCFSLTAASLHALSRGPLRLQIERNQKVTITEWTQAPPLP